MARFAPGVSGNPGGRPKGSSSLRRYALMRTRQGRELIDHALKVLRGEETDVVVLKNGAIIKDVPPGLKSKAWATEFLADRMLGKSLPGVPEDGKDDKPSGSDISEEEAALLRGPGTVTTLYPEGE